MKDEILNLNDVELRKVTVAEWKRDVCVRVMSGAERDKFNIANGKSMDNLRARLCAVCLCDDKGVRLFTDDYAEALGQKNSNAINKVFEAAFELNQIG